MRGAQHFGHRVFVKLSGTRQSCAAVNCRSVWSSFCAVLGCGGDASAHCMALVQRNWQRSLISFGRLSMTACYRFCRIDAAKRSQSGKRQWAVPVQGCCTEPGLAPKARSDAAALVGVVTVPKVPPRRGIAHVVASPCVVAHNDLAARKALASKVVQIHQLRAIRLAQSSRTAAVATGTHQQAVAALRAALGRPRSRKTQIRARHQLPTKWTRPDEDKAASRPGRARHASRERACPS